MNKPVNGTELQTLFEIGKSVTSLLDLEAVLRQVVKAAVQLTEAEESYLLLRDNGQGELYLRAEARHDSPGVENFWVRVNDAVAAQVVQTGQPVSRSDEHGRLRIKTGEPVYALVNVPLKVGQEVTGVLGVAHRQAGSVFGDDDQELLSALADWAAIAIQNARLYATVEAHNRDLELVNQVSRLVSSTLDVEEIPRLLIQRTAEIFGAECGSLALLDKERGGVVFKLAYDSEGKELKGLKDFLLPLGVGIVGLVAQTGEPRIVNNAPGDPNWSPLADQLTGFKTRKLLAVPIVAEGEILGVIEMLNKVRGDFDQNDLRLLSLVAASTASAIQNARQYAALKKTHETLKRVQVQRIAAERWAVLGKAAGGLAHRINNTTTLVPIAAQHLRELLRPVPMPPELRQEVDANLDRIERNTRYTVELATILIRRFRKNPAAAYEVNHLIEQALALVEIPPNVKVMLHLDPDLPPIATSNLFVDAMVELISNALRAMVNQEGLLRIATFQSGQDQVSVQVTDNGPGIAEQDLQRVFDMFYTTNPEGLGFGLWWVKTFLEQQRGRITVESQPGEGTTFTITLPRYLPPLHSA